MRHFAASMIVCALLAGGIYAANEISVTTSIKVSKGNYDLSRSVGGNQIDMSGVNVSSLIQDIGTGAHELIVVATDVTTNGYAYCRMLTTNATYYVDIGPQGASTNLLPFIRLYAGETAVFRLHPTNAVYAQASGGTVSLEWTVIEN